MRNLKSAVLLGRQAGANAVLSAGSMESGSSC
jgi:hypothetical protein